MRASTIQTCMVGLLVALVGGTAHAQSGTDAFTTRFDAVCAGATLGSALAARCAVVQSSTNPDARLQAAAFNHLEELPGAGRLNAGDATSGPSDDSTRVRTEIAPKLALFASLTGSRIQRGDDRIAAAFDAGTIAFTAGLDWHPAPAWQLGIAFDHAGERQDFRDSAGKLDANYNGVIALASWNAGTHVALNGYAGWLRGGQDIRRVVSFIDGSPDVAASASPDARRTLAGIAIDLDWARGAWQWRGAIGFDAMRTTTDAYLESGGSGFDLIVPQRRTDTRRGRLDVALAGTFSTRFGVWQPEFRLGLRHEFDNDSRRLGVRFVEDTGSTIVRFDTGAPDRDWAQAGVSAVFTFTHGHSAYIALDREFGHSTSTATMLSVGWRVEL
ncbi:MAG: autotransporter outer membrane beta-barrel domain-containing protein [Lysobacteraceae bacterium]